MKLTPQQEREIEDQRRADPNCTSFLMTSTPEQDAEDERKYREEMAGKEANIAYLVRLDRLLAEQTLSGALRRAIEHSESSWEKLGTASGVSVERLRNFFGGDLELNIAEFERLADALGLRLVESQTA